MPPIKSNTYYWILDALYEWEDGITDEQIDEISRRHGRVSWLTGGKDLHAFVAEVLSAAPVVPESAKQAKG